MTEQLKYLLVNINSHLLIDKQYLYSASILSTFFNNLVLPNLATQLNVHFTFHRLKYHEKQAK